MAQHDYIIANQSGAAFRADLNNGLAAIVSQNSGAAQPSTTYAYQWWSDTTTGLLKLRNAANNAWITVGTLADANLGLLSLAGGTLTGALLADDSGTAALPAIAFDGDPNTGIFRPGADQFGIATNGVERVEFGTTEVVFNDGGADVDFRIEGDTNADLFKIDAGLDEVQVANLNGGPLAGTRNRIINGDMRIDQRNAGASVTISAYGYALDRWGFQCTGGGVWTAQQSSTVPTGFVNSLALTVTTADASIASTDLYQLFQKIEGFNSSDLGWGTANAQTITVSFQVRSSVTGTYSASFQNNAFNRGYVATFTINSANTWETKTVTIPGDTSGTWTTDNSIGLQLAIDLGSGSASNITAGSWQATTTSTPRTSGSANWIATNGATFYITGVQLEPGTVATPFERRGFEQEFGLCRRYFQQLGGGMVGFEEGNTTHSYGLRFMQPMRAAPTFSLISSSFNYRYINASGSGDRTITISINGATTISTQAAWLYLNDVSAGSVLGRGAIERLGSNYINASAEL